jgi:hypothetical protein
MQCKHRDDSQPAFPLSSRGSNISQKQPIGLPVPARQSSASGTEAVSDFTTPPAPSADWVKRVASQLRLKDAILAAFHKTGGVDYLVWLSKKHPSAYATLLGRVLPTEIDGSFKAQVDMTIPQEERLAIAQELFDRAFGLMGKSRPQPQIIEAEAIQASK